MHQDRTEHIAGGGGGQPLSPHGRHGHQALLKSLSLAWGPRSRGSSSPAYLARVRFSGLARFPPKQPQQPGSATAWAMQAGTRYDDTDYDLPRPVMVTTHGSPRVLCPWCSNPSTGANAVRARSREHTKTPATTQWHTRTITPKPK